MPTPHPASSPKPPSKTRPAAPLLPIAAAVAAGIVVDRLLWQSSARDWVSLTLWWCLAGTLIGCWWMFRRWQQTRTAAIVLLAACGVLAAAWHHWNWSLFAERDLGRMATLEPEPCCLRAVAVHSPERLAAPPDSPYRAIPQGEKSQLQLRVTHVRNGDRWQPAAGECELIVDGHLLGVAAADRLQVFGQLRQPSPAMNPGQFDFALHSRADRQLCYLRSTSPECVTVIEQASGWWPNQWIDSLRRRWQARLWQTLGSEHAPTAAAILLGARHAMPREMVDTYRVTGTMHVLVVSGLHAGVLISLVMALLGMGWLPRRLGIVLAMILVACYAVLTGAHPPVMRATILAEVACMALLFGRNPFAANSLALAMIVVLAINPADLFRTGPQLSFLCAAVLLWFGTARWRRPLTPLQKLIRSVEPWYVRYARRVGASFGWAIAATFAVWIISLPLLLENYHLVTPVAVLACVPLFISVAFSLVTGFTLLIVGSLVPGTESLIAPLCQTSLSCLDAVVGSSSQVPAAYHWTPAPAFWWMIGWYALVPVVLKSGGLRYSWQRTLQIAAVWVAIGTLPVVFTSREREGFRVTFLDVGHGVCGVITTSEGTTLLYDAGSLGSPSNATETIASYLWDRGIRQIDGIVLSHADVDHFNAVPGLVDRFAIGRVFVSPHMFGPEVEEKPDSAPAELLRLLEASDVPIEVVQMGQRLLLDKSTYADVLFPDAFGTLTSDNANSLVLAVECGEHRVILPGDLEAPGIDQVMASETAQCNILLAPHHGSRRSDPPGFAAWSKPQCVVVSGGRGEVDAQVANTYRQQGAHVLHTGERGAIEFRFSAKKTSWECFHPNGL